MTNRIKFSHNWNGKLSLQVFTTIRAYTADKFLYYEKNVGEPFQLQHKDDTICLVKLLHLERMPLSQVTRGLLFIDTGMDEIGQILEMFKRFGIDYADECIILTFGRY